MIWLFSKSLSISSKSLWYDASHFPSLLLSTSGVHDPVFFKQLTYFHMRKYSSNEFLLTISIPRSANNENKFHLTYSERPCWVLLECEWGGLGFAQWMRSWGGGCVPSASNPTWAGRWLLGTPLGQGGDNPAGKVALLMALNWKWTTIFMKKSQFLP